MGRPLVGIPCKPIWRSARPGSLFFHASYPSMFINLEPGIYAYVAAR